MAIISIVATIFLLLSFLYFLNLIHWAKGPNFGWAYSNQGDRRVLSSVHGPAVQSGLRVGDQMVTINGQTFESISELQEILNRNKGGSNQYVVSRADVAITVTVHNSPLGFSRAFSNFGFTWVFGIVFFTLGAIVYIMKPGARPSWVFLSMMFCAGIYITFSFTSKLTPTILNLALIFAYAFLPATVSQLTVTFPEERTKFTENHLIFWTPYAISLVLFVAMLSTGSLLADVSPTLNILTSIYLAFSLVLFLLVVAVSYVRSSVDIARVRSQVVLMGSALAIILPVLDLMLMQFFRIDILPHPVMSVPFYFFFPLSIALSIVKHNLFDVDLYIKRTMGYAIMTLLVGSIYFFIQVGVKGIFSASALGAYSERIYPIIFAILVVFFFNPLNSRIQGLVDRLFYRKKFDYKDTVLSVSNALTTVFNLDEIIRKIIGTVRQEMYIDFAGVVLLRPGDLECEAMFLEDNPQGSEETERQECLSIKDPLISIVASEKKLLTKYDVAEDVRYADVSETTGRRFSETGTSMVIPMLYQDEVTAILALGNKKSGHLYTREDIDLLQTLCAQGAVALENARLFEENLEKGRMEEELKIAHDLQISMFPDEAPELSGISIAAHSTPAQEVGGDFYDFIEMTSEDSVSKMGIIVADVSGKAVSGALVMAAARSVFRVLSDGSIPVKEVMTIANSRLKSDVKKGMFTALLYAVIDPDSRILTLSNAGQTQPILLAEGAEETTFLETEGDRFPLGIVDQCQYEEASFDLKDGDIVVFYTDGVVEAINDTGEMYGFERLEEAIKKGRGFDAGKLMDRLNAEIHDFVGNAAQHDDITIVVIAVQ